MSALVDVARAVASYVVPIHFETATYGNTNSAGKRLMTRKRWEMRRGRIVDAVIVSRTIEEAP